MINKLYDRDSFEDVTLECSKERLQEAIKNSSSFRELAMTLRLSRYMVRRLCEHYNLEPVLGSKCCDREDCGKRLTEPESALRKEILEQNTDKTLEEVGRMLGVSRQRAWQLYLDYGIHRETSA